MPRDGWIYGSTVENGVLRYASSSAATVADPDADGGCLRKFWYQVIEGIRSPPTRAQKTGVDLHAELENYALTGEKKLSSLALAGLHMVPDPIPPGAPPGTRPGADLGVELDIAGGDPTLAAAPLRADGVPIVGYIDLVHARGTNKGVSDIQDTIDPPGTVEVIDYKCLAAGSEIYDVANGRRRDVSESGTFAVPAATSELSIEDHDATAFPSGVKQCVNVCLQGGTEIVASHDHPIMTQRGWVAAAQLLSTDWVALAAELPEPRQPTSASDDEVAFVAYMLSDGGCSQPTMRFTNMTPAVIEDWQRCAQALGYSVRENKSCSKAREFALSKGCSRWAPVVDTVRARWNLHGLAKEKRGHADLWGLSRRQVALFLNRFWACDGFMSDHAVGVQLASEKLIDDLRFLLLRLGILSRKYAVTSNAPFRSWILAMNGTAAVQFLDAVGNVLGKERQCDALRKKLSEGDRRNGSDSVPLSRDDVHVICDELGFRRRNGRGPVGGRHEVFRRLNVTRNNTVARRRFQDFCKHYNYTGLYRKFGATSIAWSPVKVVTAVGERAVFDLNVPIVHSFVANGIVVHNTTSDAKWIKSPIQMARTIQMTTYGKWVFTVEPRAEHVRLSHCYFVTKGSGGHRKVTLRVQRDDIDRQWEHVKGVVRSMKHAVAEINPDKVPANLDACDKYGGCPARERCTAAMHQALASFVGLEYADKHLNKINDSKPKDQETMGITLLDSIRAKQAPATTAAPSPVASPSPAPSGMLAGVLAPAAPAAPPAVTAADLEKLKAEEAAARAQHQFDEVFVQLEALGCGQPQIADDAARHYRVLKKLKDESPGGYAGAGQIAKVAVRTTEQIKQLIGELEAAVKSGAIVPENKRETIAPMPAPAAAAVESAPLLSPETPMPQSSLPPPAATVTVPVPIEDVTPVPQAQVVDTAATAEKKASSRKKKAEAVDEPKVEPTLAQGAKAAEVSAEPSTAINLLVDCVGEGVNAMSLHPVIDALCEAIAKTHHQVDIRFPNDNNSPLAFNKWKGALAAVIREQAIPHGTYVIDTRGSEINEVVAEAMRLRVRASGGFYVRGIR